ncbi:MAG: ATPase, partial [Clostridia bacterium]|nr:ATPase [Clostridia bacterium]
MIVPMKKVSLIIMGDKKTDTLKKLRKLGLLHIEITEGSGEKLAKLKEKFALLESTSFIVKERKKKLKNVIEADINSNALAAAEDIASLSEEIKICLAEKITLQSELDRLKTWGEIDPTALLELSEKGIEIFICEMPRDKYDELGEDITTVCLEKTKNSVKFLVTESSDDADFSAYRLDMPDMSTEEIRGKISRLTDKINELEGKIDSYAGYSECIEKALEDCEKEIEFEVYATGMTDENLSSESNSISVACFKGYIEAENIEKLKDTAKDNSWGLLIEDPTEDDNVPTKLKNNKFVSLIYPLTDFLGTVPGYFEYDISAWFLTFILIFFGIIFGDGGYGLLITTVAAIPIIKSLVSKKEVSPTFLLVGLFGLSTILWGTLTCTWFGLSHEILPEWLKSLSIPVISNVYADKLWYPFWTNGVHGLTTAQNLQIFCFSLALIQLSVAHIKVAVRNRKSLKVLGDIGAILQLIGIYYIVLSFVVNPQVF